MSDDEWANHHFTKVMASDTLNEIKFLRQKLTEALAACKVKDEALEWNKRIQKSLESLLTEAGFDQQSSVQNQLSCMSFDALAIQPDDSVLKAWLGEPEWFYRKNADGVNVFYEDIEERPHGCKPLYSPKELK